MSTTLRHDAVEVDKRGKYYEERIRQHSATIAEFHRPSVELLLNMIYTYDVTETRLTRFLVAHCLSLSGFNVLMILKAAKATGCQLHELGELLLVSRANVTGLVDSLEQKSLVERVPDKNDRRVRIAHITAQGEALLESMLPSYYTEVRGLLMGLSNAEKATLTELLAKLRHSIQRPDNCKDQYKGRKGK
jgi:MarR family 2-MHQ and catechol resistance regulon transcriptional repressor